MSIQQLSPGDKLSLKGKLFELQKKLTIIDMENRQQPEYSFRPEIKEYDLPGRHEDFAENVRRAEDTRQEKLNSLKSALETEQRSECPFSPQVVSRRPAGRVPGKGLGPRAAAKPKEQKSARPAFERLYEQGAEYRRIAEERKQRACEFDTDGNKLFSPTIPAASRRISERSSSTVGVDDFLYRAAVERSERLEGLRQSAEEAIREEAGRSRINRRSEDLLRKKYEREAREAFELLTHMVPSAPGALAGIPEEAEEFDGEVSLSSSEGGADGHLGMADTLRWGRPASVSSGLGVTLQHVQEALCLLCDESGGPPLWRHEDGRHCVAGGSKDPYHIASLVWAQLVGKGSTQVADEVEIKQFVASCVNAMARRKTGTVDLLSHFVSRVNMIELDPPPPPAPASAASVGGLSAGEYQSDDGSVETKSIRSSSTNKPIGAYPSRRPPGVGLAEATRLNAIEHEQRVEALRAEQFQREMQECTFAPRLFTAGRRSEEQGDGSTVQSNMPLDNEADDSTLASIQSICSSSAAGSSLRLPVHERLYALKSKLPDSIARQKHRRKEDVELDECTFTPNVPTRVPAPPPPIFSEGVEKAIPVLAESAGVRILDGGDIVFGSSIPIAVQSLPQPATRPHPQRARSPPREPVPQQVPPPPPRRSSEAMMRSSELGLPPHADRNSSFISVIDEFKQSSAYMSPSKAAGRRGSMRPFSPEVAVDLSGTDDGVDDGSGFVGFSFRDMETAVNRYEKSLRSVSGYSARLERSESSGSGAHSIHGDAKQPKGAEGSRVPSVPHGFAESVVRARLSREQRLRKQHAKEELGKFNEDNYRRSRAAAAKGAKPFHFHATHTKASAARAINLTEVPLEVVSPSSPVRPLPRLYIDVQLGSLAKVPKIAVHEGDDPAQLAADFCRIYALRGETVHVLTDVILNGMRQNGISIYGESDNADDTNGGDLPSVPSDGLEPSLALSVAPQPPAPQPPAPQPPAPPRPPPPKQYRYADETAVEVFPPQPLRTGEISNALNSIFLDLDDISTADGSNGGDAVYY